MIGVERDMPVYVHRMRLPRADQLPLGRRERMAARRQQHECDRYSLRAQHLTRHKISDRETGATLAAHSGWMASTQSTHLALSRGSLDRMVRCVRATSL